MYLHQVPYIYWLCVGDVSPIIIVQCVILCLRITAYYLPVEHFEFPGCTGWWPKFNSGNYY